MQIAPINFLKFSRKIYSKLNNFIAFLVVLLHQLIRLTRIMPGGRTKKVEVPKKQKGPTKKVVMEETESEYEEEHDDQLEMIEKTMEKVMNKFKASFKKEIQVQMREFEKSLDFHGARIDELINKIDDLSEKQKQMEDENQELKMKLKSMTIIVEDLEQYTRNRNLQIDGVPEEKDENLRDLMKEIGKKVEVQFEDKEVDAIHRIPTRNEKNKDCSPIVVQFTTRQLREKILTNAKKTTITTKDLQKSGDEKTVYINEHLTKAKKEIMYEARKLKFQQNYKFLWSRNGKIFIRKGEKTKVIELQSLDDLAKIK